MTERKTKSDADPGIPALEWVVAALGLLLFLSAIGIIIAKGIQGDDEPPIIVLEAREVLPSGDRWLLSFEARNEGDATAAGLTIRGELFVGDSLTETVETDLDYVPGNSRRGGGLYFASDPRTGRVALSPVAYRDP